MQQQTVDAAQERSRLIDHFKRAYQIIVGLAITLACTKLFPNDDPSIPWAPRFGCSASFSLPSCRSFTAAIVRSTSNTCPLRRSDFGAGRRIYGTFICCSLPRFCSSKSRKRSPVPRCWAEHRAAAGEVCETIPGNTSPVRHFACRAGARSQRSPRHHVFMDASGSSSRKLRTPRQFLYSRLAVPRAGF